jgi:hypothetical protein
MHHACKIEVLQANCGLFAAILFLSPYGLMIPGNDNAVCAPDGIVAEILRLLRRRHQGLAAGRSPGQGKNNSEPHVIFCYC